MSTTVILSVTTAADVSAEELAIYVREQLERSDEVSDLPEKVWERLDEDELHVSQNLAVSKAVHLVLAELQNARRRYPHFAVSVGQGFAVLMRECGEVANAVVKGDNHGPHGVTRETAQVAAVAIRIIEMCEEVGSASETAPCGDGRSKRFVRIRDRAGNVRAVEVSLGDIVPLENGEEVLHA